MYIRHGYNDSTELYCSSLTDWKIHRWFAAHPNLRSLFA